MKISLRKAARSLVTHYDVLGCSPSEDTEAIHSKYLELAFTLHPDRGGDEDKFKAVALAWSALKTKESRKQYDTQLYLGRLLNCPNCKGQGRRGLWDRGSYKKNAPCPECGGKGHL